MNKSTAIKFPWSFHNNTAAGAFSSQKWQLCLTYELNAPHFVGSKDNLQKRCCCVLKIFHSCNITEIQNHFPAGSDCIFLLDCHQQMKRVYHFDAALWLRKVLWALVKGRKLTHVPCKHPTCLSEVTLQWLCFWQAHESVDVFENALWALRLPAVMSVSTSRATGKENFIDLRAGDFLVN